MTESLNDVSPKEREFIDSRAFVMTLAETPTDRWPPAEYLRQKAKEIVHVD